MAMAIHGATMESESSRGVLQFNINNLTDDLLLEILHRLPCQSALRCTSVSKRWFSLISNPYFVRLFIDYHHRIHNSSSHSFTLVYEHMHMSKLESKTSVGKYSGWTVGRDPQAPFEFKSPFFKSCEFHLNFVPCSQSPPPVFVLASCNDLLLCRHYVSFPRVYYICNPLTKQSLALPPAPGCHKRGYAGLVYVPNSAINTYRYKVVTIATPKRESFPTPIKSFEVEIFCSETCEWSKSVVSSGRWGRWLAYPFAYNGMLHWLSRCRVVVFDPFNNVEKCNFIDLPIDIEISTAIGLRLGVCRGRLRICKISANPVSLSVWEIQDYNAGKWSLQHKVNLKEMVLEDSWFVKEVKEKGDKLRVYKQAFHPNDGDIMYLNLNRRLVLCNMRRRTLKVDSEFRQVRECTMRGWSKIFTLEHPWWPTPLPLLPRNVSSIGN